MGISKARDPSHCTEVTTANSSQVDIVTVTTPSEEIKEYDPRQFVL
jgi:hypothetical protein